MFDPEKNELPDAALMSTIGINAWPTEEDGIVEHTISRDRDTTTAAKVSTNAQLANTYDGASVVPTGGTSTRPSASASVVDPGPPPDGGALAWTQVLMVHITTASTFGYIVSFGTFQTYYQSTLGVSPSAISWIGSVQIFLLFFIGTFSGRALDAGLFHYVYITGSVFQLIGIFTTSLATKYWQLFLAQALCTGIANGLHFTPSTSLVTTYFAKKRSLVVGIAALGSCTGGVIFPIIVQQLLPRVGFGWTIRVIGFVMVATNAITIAFYRTRLPPRKTGPIVEWGALNEAPYVLYCTGCWFIYWGLYFAFFYVGAYGRDVLGVSYSDSINLLLTIICTGFVWRLLPNFFADRVGPLNTIIPLAFFCGIMVYAWIGIRSIGSLWAFVVIYGSGSAGIQSMYPAALASLTDDLGKAGVRMGMSFTIVSFACLTGPPLAGALIQMHHGDYLYAQIWGGTTFLVGGLFLIAARVAKVGWRLNCRV